jgi:hypothetical protein
MVDADARLAAMERQIHELQIAIERLADVVARSSVLPVAAVGDEAPTGVGPVGGRATGLSRRQMLTAAAAGAGGLLAVGVVDASPAAAVSGADFVLGSSNDSGTSLSVLTSSNTSATFDVNNASTGIGMNVKGGTSNDALVVNTGNAPGHSAITAANNTNSTTAAPHSTRTTPVTDRPCWPRARRRSTRLWLLALSCPPPRAADCSRSPTVSERLASTGKAFLGLECWEQQRLGRRPRGGHWPVAAGVVARCWPADVDLDGVLGG